MTWARSTPLWVILACPVGSPWAAGYRQTLPLLARLRGLLAVVVGVVDLGVLATVGAMERGQLQTLALQLWWLAGLFWGGFVLLPRPWLDQ